MATDKLRTSREVYDQIRWDSRFDASTVIIGLQDREHGIEEIPYAAFDPHGEIPWHRILYFRDETHILWDRRERLDNLIHPSAI